MPSASRETKLTDDSTQFDPAQFHALMAESMRWAHLFVTIDEIAQENAELVRDLKKYDPVGVVPLLAGLLTVPDYQSNCIRLEILVALAVTYCRGRKKAHIEQAKKWFHLIGTSQCIHGEAPAEDVFVSLVQDDRRDYRLLEGVWEGSGFHTQRVLEALRARPDNATFAQTTKNVRALLTIADIVCERAGLGRYQIGSDSRHSTLSSNKLPGGRALTSRVTIDLAELERRGITRSDIEPFVLQPQMLKTMATQLIGSSYLDSHPLIMHGDATLLAALPSSLSIAARNYAIEKIVDGDLISTFDAALAENYSRLFADTPLLGGPLGVQVQWNTAGPHRCSAVGLEIDNGYYLSIHAFLPSVQTHLEGAFKTIYQTDAVLMEALNRSIKTACSHFANQPHFKGGVIIVVGCGWGKGYVTDDFDIKSPRWRFQGMSADDLVRMSRVRDMNPSYFWRIQDGLDAVTKAGVEIQNVNGILNLVGWVRHNNGHFVPQDSLQEETISPNRPLLLLPPSNLLRDVRAEIDSAYDRHGSTDDTGRRHDVQRAFPYPFFDSESLRRVYTSMDDLRHGALTSVYEGKLCLWMSVSTPHITQRNLTYRLWEMAHEWHHRIGAALDAVIAPSVHGRSLTVHIKFNDGDLDKKAAPRPTLDRLAALCTVGTTKDPNVRMVTFHCGFLAGFQHADNVAERLFVRNVVIAYLQIIGLETEKLVATIEGQVVVSPDARHFHLLQTQNFMDHVADTLPTNVVGVDAIDDAAVKIGLGWRVRPRSEGNKITGRQACTDFLAKIVDVLLEDTVDALAHFDRRSTLKLLVANCQKASAERNHWVRTSAAVLGLQGDNPETHGRFVEWMSKFSAAAVSSRVLTEVALCACPDESGGPCSSIELSKLIARIALIIRIGGFSDAIHYNALAPEVTISSLGDVLVRDEFGRLVVEPMLARATHDRVMQAAPLQRKNYDEPKVAGDFHESVGDEFWNTWKIEMGFDLNEALYIIDALEKRGMAVHSAILEIPRSEYFDLVRSTTVSGEAAARFLDQFSLTTRPLWENVPRGFDRKDIYPWRLGRRLSFMTRPILNVDDGSDPALLIGLGALRSGFAYVVDGAYNGRLEQSFFRTDEMRNTWWGKARDGHGFNAEVAQAAVDANWTVRRNLGLPELLGQKVERDMGDIDVLAWRHDRRQVLVVECKDLSLARNYSEIAALLSDYQGAVVNGRKDRLKKHLDRVSLLRRHRGQVERFTGVREPQVVSGLACSGVVPMQYAKIPALADTRVGSIEDILKL